MGDFVSQFVSQLARGVWRAQWARCVAVLASLIAIVLPARAQPESPVRVSITTDHESVAAGGQLVVGVTFDHQPNWHIHTNDPKVPASWDGFVAIPTRVTVTDVSGAKVGPVQWPKAHALSLDLAGTGKAEKYEVFEGRSTAFVPLQVQAGATGEVTAKIEVSYQACDDSTCMPEETLTLNVKVPVGADTKAASQAALFTPFKSDVFAKAAEWAGATKPAPTKLTPQAGNETFLGVGLPQSGGLVGVLRLMFFAVVGGLILNLTPCVLPVIPIKVMTLSKHAGSQGRMLYLGSWMAAGVIAFWVGIGLPVLFVSSLADPTRIFSYWYVTLGLGLLIAVLAVGMLGLFQINLPQSAYAITPRADSAAGSFLFGVMTAVLGLPCFGFIAGALLAAAAILPKVATLAIFLGIGVGMALPYLVLALRPTWLNFIPRTGPASDLVKQVMAVLMLGAAAYFIGAGLIALVAQHAWLGEVLHILGAALCIVGAGLWMLVRTLRIAKSTARRAIFGVLALALCAAGVWVGVDAAMGAKHNFWKQYSRAAFDEARARGDVVVLDFTAIWCLNCHALKSRVLDKDPVRSAIRLPGVTPLLANLDAKDAPGWTMLREGLGRTGIPTLAIFAPGSDKPWVVNAYTSGQVIDALKAAGVDVSKVQVAGFKSADPQASSSQPSGTAQQEASTGGG